MKVKNIKTMHMWYGVLLLITFILTGQYMYHVLDKLQQLPDGMRMLYRSSHIYILLSSIINLVLGLYMSADLIKKQIKLQILISFIIVIAPITLILGFFLEPNLFGGSLFAEAFYEPANGGTITEIARPYTRIGLYSLFVVAILLVIQHFRIKNS